MRRCSEGGFQLVPHCFLPSKQCRELAAVRGLHPDSARNLTPVSLARNELFAEAVNRPIRLWARALGDSLEVSLWDEEVTQELAILLP